MRWIFNFLVSFAVLFGPFSYADTSDEKKNEKKDTKKSEEELHNTIFDRTHRVMSHGIVSIAEDIDHFFGDENFIPQGQTSRGVITLTSTVIDRVGLVTQFNLNLQLRLPRTESRLRIVIDNASDEKRNDEVDPTALEKAKAETEDNGLSAALRYLFPTGEKWNIKSDLGLKVQLPTIDAFASLNVHRSYSLWRWTLQFNQNFFWFNSTGFGEVTRTDIDFPLPNKFLLRFSNSASWLLTEEFFRFNHNFTLYHPLDGGRSLSYAIGASGTSTPTAHMEAYSVAASYRQNILRKWIFLNVIPGVSFSKTNSLDPAASIAFRIESIFGKF